MGQYLSLLDRADTPVPAPARLHARDESDQSDKRGVRSLLSLWSHGGSRRAEDQIGTGLPVVAAAKPALCEPALLPDGRRLHRFRASEVPSSVPPHVPSLLVEARWCGAVLVADGLELIVVERWLSRLPWDALLALKDDAGAVIALLRGESHARSGEGGGTAS